jgi:hypothetical protein
MKANRPHQDRDFEISKDREMSGREQKCRKTPRQLRSFPYAFVRDSPLSNCKRDRIGETTARRYGGVV